MKPYFDNLAFLKIMTPNVEHLTKLETQRNWAIGISLALILPVAFFAYQAYQLDKNLTAIKKTMPATNNDVTTKSG